MLVLFGTLVLASCQKEYEPFLNSPIIDSTGTDTTGTDTTGTDTSTLSSSYMPLSVGSVWTYKDSGALNTTYTVTVLMDSVIKDGVTYRKLHSVSPVSETDSYYGIKNHNLYFNGNGAATDLEITMLVLNDTASVGGMWSYDMGLINGIPAIQSGKILEKDISIVVAGKTYNNVVHSQATITYIFETGNIDAGVYDFWFAKGIGPIKSTSAVDFLGVIAASKTDLLSYSIK